MALTQVQVIQSLGEALTWYERELDWGVAPGELRHLTGRIGELYAAMITRGQMALDTNQRGYDVISAENERISVKTVTTANHVAFNTNTFQLCDRVMVLRVNVDPEEGVSVEELLDCTASELREKVSPYGDAFRLSISLFNKPSKPLDHLQVDNEIYFERYTLRQYESGTILVLIDGEPQLVAKPHLRKIAATLGVDILNGSGGKKNTRQLGADIIKTLKARGET
ncbi:hypothetical protein FIV06_01490 [Labrenzia sp. THAF191b]|uniref:DUF6998 domain-containing protein n=1 Tax=unclassified Labrenzia TaxID=2648686 RepID=UPI0012689B41|nr:MULTISPECIES: hypothetical protein [unclassified Labrenzia]QFS96072.1 hypothetical protein FIV06_01490 [Labrenzia sp. THAF191b]QFT02387.1 hypothetical protein FIV05_01490 [Labrenzia sp. THAF191a]QFT13929.1 hypothetical protein FIV03_01495 [Labrenzia sp. THAF187b]